MVESTALRKPGAASLAMEIDAAVVLIFWRDLFRDGSKFRRTAWPSTMNHEFEFVYFCFLSGRSSSLDRSVGYNRNVSKVPARASKRSGTQSTLKRSIQRKRSPPKKVIISSISFFFIKHVSVNGPDSRGTERGTRRVPAPLSRSSLGNR